MYLWQKVVIDAVFINTFCCLYISLKERNFLFGKLDILPEV